MSTLEILIAFAVLTLSITGVIVLFFGNQSTAIDTQTNIEAISKAQTLMEQARALARQDFDAVQTTIQTQDDIYKKQTTVTFPDPSDPDTKLVSTQVTWLSNLRPLTVNFSSIFTNTTSSGSFCSPSVPSPDDWKNPTPYMLDTRDLVGLAIGNNSNGLGVSGITVYRNKLYIAANATPSADTANNTLYIFGLPNNPSLAPTFLGFTPTTGDSLAAVTVMAGTSVYAYVASSKSFNFSNPSCTNVTCPQFQVIDVTTPTSPNLLGGAGRMMPVAGSSGQGVGKSIYYDRGYVYLGLTKSAGSSDTEFNIIDVGGGSASPTNPTRVGGYHVGFTVESIYVKGNYAYLATSDNAAGNKQLLILDISNKTSPHLTTSPVGGFFTAPGVGVGYGVQVVGTKAYLGRAFSGATTPNFYILDATNPASYPSPLPVLGSKIAGVNDSVNALTVRDFLAFLVTNKEFQVWDVTNPSTISPWTVDGTTSTFLPLTNIDAKINGSSSNSCSGDLLYLALQTSLGTNRDIIATIGPHVASAYSLSNSGDITVMQGNTGSVSITAAIISGFPGTTSFSVSGLPAGVTGIFTPSACSPSCTTTLTITTSPVTTTGNYPVTVTGTGGVTTTFVLHVTAIPFDYTLSNSGNITADQGSVGSNTVTRTLVSGTTQPVTLAVTGLPAGATATVGNNGCAATCSGTLSISTAFPATPVGTYLITVTDAGNSKTTTFNLVVNAQPFDYTLTPPSAQSMTRNSSISVSITVTKTGGVAQSVSGSLSGFQNGVSVLPATASCTPATGTCALTFVLTTNNNAQKVTRTITVTAGSPAHTTTFSLTVN